MSAQPPSLKEGECKCKKTQMTKEELPGEEKFTVDTSVNRQTGEIKSIGAGLTPQWFLG